VRSSESDNGLRGAMSFEYKRTVTSCDDCPASEYDEHVGVICSEIDSNRYVNVDKECDTRTIHPDCPYMKVRTNEIESEE